MSREVRGIGTRAVAGCRRDVGQPDNSESSEGLFHGGGLNRLKCCGVGRVINRHMTPGFSDRLVISDLVRQVSVKWLRWKLGL